MMPKPPRTSLIPTLIILSGLGAIGAPIVFAAAFLGTRHLGLGVAITAGACVGIPAVFAATVIGLGYLSNRRVLRYALSRCTRCGYDLRGTDGTLCPECGTPQRVRYE